MLDLFKLHVDEEDISPRSWICASGENLSSIISRIVRETLEKKSINISTLAKIMSKRFATNLLSIIEWLKGRREYIPLVAIKVLLSIWKETFQRPFEELKKEIVQNIEYLKQNNGKCHKIKAPNSLTEELAKLAGAHAADGTLGVRVEFYSRSRRLLEGFIEQKFPNCQNNMYFEKSRGTYCVGFNVGGRKNKAINKIVKTDQRFRRNKILIRRQYVIGVSDQYKESLIKYSKWLFQCFGKYVRIEKAKDRNLYMINFKDKIIARIFYILFEFPLGKKSLNVKEPPIIRNSTFNTRKSFAIGAMMFDGSAYLNGYLSFSSKSKKLCESIKEVMKIENIASRLRKDEKRKIWHLKVKAPNTLGEGYSKASYFEKGSTKWFRVILSATREFTKKARSKKDLLNFLDQFYSPASFSKIGVKDVFFAIRKLKESDMPTITSFLINDKKLSNLDSWTVQNYLEILRKADVVKKSSKKVIFVRKTGWKLNGTKGATFRNIYTFNSDINSWRIPDLGDKLVLKRS
ncbi:MAG: hypothetical protein QMD14_05540 [Candidatus Aenigmarchaeota archaeon]|nr:hypothetical protein [Candidatus Aenigmarchaeota archaeon]